MKISRQFVGWGLPRRLFLLWWFLPAFSSAQTLTLPHGQRPEWLRRDGIVMAGSWEPLLFRVRRDGGEGYTPTVQQQADYLREHSPEMVAKLKSLGVNFVMMHCYKGGGLNAERQSMDDAVRFAQLCHEAGLYVGVYNYSGAFIWELFFKEEPGARDWVVLDAQRQPIPYGSGAAYRYYWNRNHPAAEAFYQGLVRFAVNDIKADLIHFDNYSVGPGYDAVSVERFRRYLQGTFSSKELAEANIDITTAQPSVAGSPELLRRAWMDFTCASLAESYHRMNRFARGLRPDILVELNPGGVGSTIRPPVDHGRLLAGGEAYWDESAKPSYQNGRLVSRVRTYKVGRALENMVFSYLTTPLEAAESMAFNLDCLGAICWFEYGWIVERPGAEAPMSDRLAPYVRFYRERHDLFRDTTVVADVAVLRSFPSQVFDPNSASLTARVEDALILGRRCFQIIHDHQLADLGRYRALVLAGCVALSDTQMDQIQRYVTAGGRLCIIGPAATHDQWMRPRLKPGLEDLPADRVVRVPADGDWRATLRSVCPGGLSLSVATPEGPPTGLCCELTEQPNRRLVHFVNYRDDRPVHEVDVRLRIPAGRKVASVTLMGPEHEDRALTYTTKDGVVAFAVPAVKVYEIAAVTWGAPDQAGSKGDTAVEPIRLHPDHPHYFQFRGRPTVLITAGEHYGAVLNLDFDYVRYLDVLKAHEFNLTRTFSGTYREMAGSFRITGNPLAPADGRFVCPWARSETPGAADGGNRFDLTKWDEAYLARLKDFIIQAGRRGVVVELVFFCTMYDDTLWNASPMNMRNNINGIGNVARNEVYSAKDKDLLAAQQAVVRQLVRELNEFDNLYYEVCNEPYERGGLSRQWNDRIVAAIVETEASLPKKHLIAQGFPPSSKPIGDLNPHIGVLNFHAAKPEAVRLNYPLNRVVAFDETGGADRSDRKYRTEGWEFLLAGGGVYDHLDFSFTPDRADGTAVPLPPGTPGGGGPELRRQLAVLKRFIESFDFIRMKPALSIVRGPLPDGTSIQVLAEPGRAYAIYLKGGRQADLVLDLPAGSYGAEWIDTKTESVAKAEQFEHGGGSRTLASPAYSEDIALRVQR